MTVIINKNRMEHRVPSPRATPRDRILFTYRGRAWNRATLEDVIDALYQLQQVQGTMNYYSELNEKKRGN